VKRKTKLNATLTGWQSEVRGSLVRLYSTLLNLSTRVEAISRSDKQPPSEVLKPVLKHSGLYDQELSEQQASHGNSSMLEALENQLVALSTTIERHSDLVNKIQLLSNQ